jgi:carbonyl reductase 1
MQGKEAKRVLVTGANKGIGFCIADDLAKQGYLVVMGCRNLQEGKKAAKQISDKYKDAKVDLLKIDLNSERSVVEAARDFAQRFGKLDILINNAAIAEGGIKHEPLYKQAEIICKANYFGTLMVCQHFFPLLNNGARVINVSSTAGCLERIVPSKAIRDRFLAKDLTIDQLNNILTEYFQVTRTDKFKQDGWPETAYGISKAALNGLTRIYAQDQDLKERGITVNSSDPGWCRTDLGTAKADHSPEEGADVNVWLATSSEVEGVTGKFFSERKEIDW